MYIFDIPTPTPFFSLINGSDCWVDSGMSGLKSCASQRLQTPTARLRRRSAHRQLGVWLHQIFTSNTSNSIWILKNRPMESYGYLSLLSLLISIFIWSNFVKKIFGEPEIFGQVARFGGMHPSVACPKNTSTASNAARSDGSGSTPPTQRPPPTEAVLGHAKSIRIFQGWYQQHGYRLT